MFININLRVIVFLRYVKYTYPTFLNMLLLKQVCQAVSHSRKDQSNSMAYSHSILIDCQVEEIFCYIFPCQIGLWSPNMSNLLTLMKWINAIGILKRDILWNILLVIIILLCATFKLLTMISPMRSRAVANRTPVLSWHVPPLLQV